jgi:two-component system, sensor histidine kinase
MRDALECLDRSADEVARRKGEFLSLAAHSLSQPMQTLELAYSAIQRTQRADAELSELARTSLARLRTLLGQLLEISRVESGSIQLDEQLISVSEVCADLERHFGPLARGKGLGFRRSACSSIIETDPVLLGSVLSNLVSNAICFTSTGEISLECRSSAEGSVEVAVHDSGIGIRQQQLHEIFQDFYRSEAARQIAPEGFGLGLGLVRRWSKLLGFPVTVRSEVGRGSTFTIQIPAEKVRAFPTPETIASS